MFLPQLFVGLFLKRISDIIGSRMVIKMASIKITAGKYEADLETLFTPKFLDIYCGGVNSIDEFFREGGFVVMTTEDLKAISESELDSYARKVSRYKSWRHLLAPPR